MTIFVGLSLVTWLVAIGLHLLITFLAARHLGRGPSPDDAPLPPVSILKPLKKTIPALRENLESFFRLDYPMYELLFAVADPADPALGVALQLMEKYPHVAARVFVSPEGKIGNPKFATLLTSFEAAEHDWILISDANVRVAPDYLRRQTRYVAGDVGMVACLPSGCEPEGLGGWLDAVYLNTFYARGALFCIGAGEPATSGKSQLFRRSASRGFGGLSEVGQHLGADVRLGTAFLRAGWRVVTNAQPVRQIHGYLGMGDFWRRHLRWGRVRRRMAPMLFSGELLVSSVGSGVLGAFALSSLFPIAFGTVLAAHFAVWYVCDIVVIRLLDPGARFLPTTLAWIAREALNVPLWLHILAGNEAIWVGSRLRLDAAARIG